MKPRRTVDHYALLVVSNPPPICSLTTPTISQVRLEISARTFIPADQLQDCDDLEFVSRAETP